jgi:2-octaprenyl-6-methoxyphenol hydroxylase
MWRTIRAVDYVEAAPHVEGMKPIRNFDVFVAGTGPAGLTVALAMANAGFSVAIAGPKRTGKDGRTTALMVPAIALFDRLDVWTRLEKHAAPLVSMQIIDGTSRLVRAQPVQFHANEIGEAAFGWNMPNEIMLLTLEAEVSKHREISVFSSMVDSYDTRADNIAGALANGETVCAKLVVAADGRNSIAREAAGIELKNWTYPQTAMVLTFAHSRGHSNTSTEFHTETGPFTTVPLPGNRSSLVWVMSPDDVDDVSAISDEILSRRIETKMQSILGKVSVDSPRQFYPLSAQTPSSFAAKRIMLVGEAAHVFPPIGAQGLNLGLRDVEEAVASAMKFSSDPGSEEAMRHYSSSRRGDILLRTGAVDLLNRSLLSSFLPVQLARSAGMAALDTLPPLRGFFMREGLRPGSGWKSMFGYAGNKSAGK